MLCHVLLAQLLPFELSFFFNDTAPTEIYTLSLHDALPISLLAIGPDARARVRILVVDDEHTLRESCAGVRSEEHTSELQSPDHLVCRLLLEKKNKPSTNRAHQRPDNRYPHHTHSILRANL